MSLAIAGAGWITPLGSGVDEVWGRLCEGEEAAAQTISAGAGKKSYPVFRVPADALKELPIHPRLRRAGAISRFAAAAGLAALRDGGLQLSDQIAARTALIFAIANGGVVYTKRFYHDIVATGAESASPLLFPETVFNAPASHLAAILGIAGACYTLVGDGAIGVQAIGMAEDLMANENLDYCLVVAAEEADWLLADAYAKWRLIRARPPIEPFGKPARGTILSEGAGAVLLSREGRVQIEAVERGAIYSSRRKLGSAISAVLRGLEAPAQATVIASANGTFIDRSEAAAIAEVMTDAVIYTAKPALGESVGAGGLWQTIAGMKALQTGRLPPVLHATTGHSGTVPGLVIVLSCGLNQQVSGLRLAL